MEEKAKLLHRLKQDLLGPLNDDELLFSYPSDVYLTGILFPPKSNIPEEDMDQLQAEGCRDVDANDASQDEVSLATVKRPASAGISFVVESNATPTIDIVVTGSRYQQEHDSASLEEREVHKASWRRRPIHANLANVTLDFDSKDYAPVQTGVDGLGIHIRISRWEHRFLVTVAMINLQNISNEYERASYEELCFFQTELRVSCAAGTVFCPRPLGGAAIDEDTRMSKLLYRDVKEFAVGHTCSAEWEEKEGAIVQVRSTWLPDSIVKAMSSEGVAEFKPLSEEGAEQVLSTAWLAQAHGDTLIEGLSKLPSLYQTWLASEEEKIITLDVELRHQAGEHIENAKNVSSRMEASIALIKKDKQVEMAFRLANKAIELQRKWTNTDDDKPLVWRPFQLGFILLTLESIADDQHADRNVADLLWFPTGGGKTEAYLGLISFTLFLRRLRYGEEGAGVASFMRYTLRLLTVQQFQRAAALICACESLRLGYDLPDGIQPDLTSTPFSLGLWVGGDTTPNRFDEAQKAMADTNAYNRPDQLKYCPRHTGTRLTWRLDNLRSEVIATCDHPECLWHEQPLPIWTVDNNIYHYKPSLVIGTIDKFAQIARNPETTNLFGHNTIYRQPDLIIQDELHLISGPLGTLAGLYEIAIDKLCSKDAVVPKIIASTATIRQASSQIKALFNRETCLFPPPVLDARNSGFAVEDEQDPGRQYVGLTTAGRSAKFTLQATTASLMQAVKSDEISDTVRDDFWTMVTYFNSLRELGGALVLMQDDVANSLIDYAGRRKEEPRTISEPMELTSRVSSSEIKNYLDQLTKKYREQGACDAVLASNMISVGVDVPRLGQMIVNGQPKGIAEYIQATSRVGRRRSGPGGLVVTIYNNAKSRDRSHYETFNTWHMALYREVEATSVTPFAPCAREKALHVVLVILARHLVPALNNGVSNSEAYQNTLEEFIEYIADRAESIDCEEAENVEDSLHDFLDKWIGSAAAYKQYWNDKAWNKSLMVSAEKAAEIKSRSGTYQGRAIPTPNSMRSVEPGCLYVLEEKLR